MGLATLQNVNPVLLLGTGVLLTLALRACALAIYRVGRKAPRRKV